MSLYMPRVFTCLSVRTRIDVVRVMCIHAAVRTYTSYRGVCHVYSCAYLNVHVMLMNVSHVFNVHVPTLFGKLEE